MYNRMYEAYEIYEAYEMYEVYEIQERYKSKNLTPVKKNTAPFNLNDKNS